MHPRRHGERGRFCLSGGGTRGHPIRPGRNGSLGRQKVGWGQRPLGIPTIRDRVVQTACKADDFVVLYKEPFTDVQLGWSRDKLEREGLRLNEDKTCVVGMSKRRSEFDFLGFNFKRVPCFWKKGRWYMKVQPSRKSQRKFKDAIREIQMR